MISLGLLLVGVVLGVALGRLWPAHRHLQAISIVAIVFIATKWLLPAYTVDKFVSFYSFFLLFFVVSCCHHDRSCATRTLRAVLLLFALACAWWFGSRLDLLNWSAYSLSFIWDDVGSVLVISTLIHIAVFLFLLSSFFGIVEIAGVSSIKPQLSVYIFFAALLFALAGIADGCISFMSFLTQHGLSVDWETAVIDCSATAVYAISLLAATNWLAISHICDFSAVTKGRQKEHDHHGAGN